MVLVLLTVRCFDFCMKPAINLLATWKVNGMGLMEWIPSKDNTCNMTEYAECI